MVTKEQVLEALRDVEDPEVHRSIVELEMVKSIEISDSHVRVEVLLTIRGCPLHTTIENAVREKLLSLSGVKTVDVQIGHMTDEERARFAEAVRGKPANQGTPTILDPAKGVEFIAIASGKGGVGKSTVTANLGRALSQMGLRVGIIDADIYGFSIPGIFGLKYQKPTVIDDLIMPIEIGNLRIISMHYFVPENNPVVWRGPMLGKMLRNFFGEVYWGDLDVMLLDLPPGTGDIALDVHQLLPKSKEIIVTTPQPGAADVAVRSGLMGLRTNHQIIGVVENMSYYTCANCGEKTYLFGRGGGDRVARELQTEVLQQIPIADMSKDASALFTDGSPQAQAYHTLAQQVVKAAKLGVPATI
ncbi:Mrp/NBP35 family ATP-binding protein [Alicyclobacillus cycloheptanicus]|uniref:Iron-sulfur cluster carrier protein n=1 Tax=Alicyclobacillus cycloheptanicus TaxID=1457 RepID=A0ABT9XL96_9BACL|nr:P-loop NTPase [Alicyclobacillus cycloheptanicus]MDQ0191081.1 ATP-binding protein involved in chromosome partitioning [Alicyclobacillus cycloheptanicus]WDM00875.1 Mrp/NBP35 family ATP-binding protein [Alicyclobacillus cycloheptanicus]